MTPHRTPTGKQTYTGLAAKMFAIADVGVLGGLLALRFLISGGDSLAATTVFVAVVAVVFLAWTTTVVWRATRAGATLPMASARQMTLLGLGTIIAFCGVALDTFRLFEMRSGFGVTVGALCAFIIAHVVVGLWTARTQFTSEVALLGQAWLWTLTSGLAMVSLIALTV